jgi:hypothetical protein
LYSSAAHLRAIERRTADVRALEQVRNISNPKREAAARVDSLPTRPIAKFGSMPRLFEQLQFGQRMARAQCTDVCRADCSLFFGMLQFRNKSNGNCLSFFKAGTSAPKLRLFRVASRRAELIGARH